LSYVQGDTILRHRTCPLVVPSNKIIGGILRIIMHKSRKLLVGTWGPHSTFLPSIIVLLVNFGTKSFLVLLRVKSLLTCASRIWIWFCHRWHAAVVALYMISLDILLFLQSNLQWDVINRSCS
jgi:hypothetical protein